jgi:protein-tyrosine phosphatase
MYHSHIETDYRKYQFGKNNYVLLEFSTKAETLIEEICFDVTAMGYQVIVAHVERYNYLKLEDIIKIKLTGALLQTNASAILNQDKLANKKTVKKLIKENLIDIIATDTHNMKKRPPNLLEARKVLKKYYDESSLGLMFNRIEL